MKYSLEEIKKLIKIIYNEHFKCSISMIIYSDDLEKKKILDSIKNINISQKRNLNNYFLQISPFKLQVLVEVILTSTIFPIYS